MNNIEKLKEYLNTMAETSYIIGLMHWELDNISPKKSHDYLISVKTKEEVKLFTMATSKEYRTLIENALKDSSFSKLSIEEQTYLKDLEEELIKDERVPKDFYEKYSSLTSKSQVMWAEAKKNNDYNIFKPYLEEMINMTKEYYSYRYPNEDLYDSMLNDYEKGVKSTTIDELFTKLKEAIIPIVKNLPKPLTNNIEQEFSDSELINIAKYLLNYIGFDNERGALGIYPHGYTTKLNNNDIRITFSNNKSIFDHVCTVIHEGGHGIFEQSIGPNISQYLTYDINKYALHESQSRFYENILGRNKNFWVPIYDELKPKLKLNISLNEFIKYLNNAHPSLVRTEADELTYCLHIIMRYEIERMLFKGEITASELPAIWNQKTKEYLGLDIINDKDGILQDVHWSQGSFGYFPSYLLGSILDGMLLETINNKLGSIDNILKEGHIKKITKFLQDNIHKYGGTYNICEVAKRVCGQDLTVEPLINYFKNKYQK